MQSALDVFNSNLERVSLLHAVHGSVEKKVQPVVDLSDILRSEIVMAVSAFDFFIHELTRLGMLECLSGTRPQTESFKRFPLPTSIALSLNSSSDNATILNAQIRERHNFLSFQHPDKVAEAIRLFSDIRLWEEVGSTIGCPAKTAKATLGLIVDRRNKIAHEADIDPSFPGQRWPIDRPLVETMLGSLKEISQAIFRATS